MAFRLAIEVPNGGEYELHPAPLPIPEGDVCESSICYFHLRGDDLALFGVELHVDEVPLERVALSPEHVRWKWMVGFHAGIAQLQLLSPESPTIVLELITDPVRAKLTRLQFSSMVGDILDDTFALVSLAGLRTRIAQGNVAPFDFARFELLRARFEKLEHAIRLIDKSPWSRLERTERSIPLGHCSGARPLELSKAVNSARQLAPEELERLSSAGQRLASGLNNRLPTTVRLSEAKPNHRRREHAEILGFIKFMQGFLQSIATRLSTVPSESPQFARCAILQRHCTEMFRRLKRIESLSLFEGVLPRLGVIATSHLFQRVSIYRQFYKAYRDFLCGLGNVSGEFLALPLRRTFDLYELWCFLRLLRTAAEEVGPSAEYRNAFEEHPDRLRLVLTIRGKPFRCGRITLVFKPTYREVWKTDGPRVGSFSREMIPDIAFEGTCADTHTVEPVIVLDAKYRIETEIDHAIQSIHMYRDALVRRADDDSVSRTVQAAFVLSPQDLVGNSQPSSWKDDSAPQVFFRQGYRETFKFGALAMKPGITIEQCREVLQTILAAIDESSES